MASFLEALRSGRVLLMDGAMGTELWKAGLRQDEDGSLWNLQHPERVAAVHAAYARAGAEVVLTNTFQANPSSLLVRGQLHRLTDVFRSGVALARASSPAPPFVLADVGAFEASASERVRHFRECQELLGIVQGVDALLAETWTDLPSLLSLLRANADCASPLPMLVSVTYVREPNGRVATAQGEAPRNWAVQMAQQPGVAALGVNCGRDIGMDEVLEIVRRYRDYTDLPLFARPNAGTPTQGDGDWSYPRTPEILAQRLPELFAAGATMIGGCCGTTPATIAAFGQAVQAWNTR